MSSTSESSFEEMFQCAICLEVFSEPVSIPCGHNFCKCCICEVWDTNGPCKCPLCNKRYLTRPELSVNYLLLKMVSQFKLEADKSKSQVCKPGEVACDVCSAPKLKALKSCLVCLSLFCENHLQPHLTVSGLKRHKLMEPVENLEDRMCSKHQSPLELLEVWDLGSSSLLHTQAHSQHVVEQKKLKVKEIQHCMELSATEVHRERAAGQQVFITLMQSVQRRQDRFLKELQEKQNRSHKRAQKLVQQLEQEICELEKSSTLAERLSRSKDPLHFQQSCLALMPPARLKEWSSVSFEPETCVGSVDWALSELEKRLSKDSKQLFKQLPSRLKLLKVQQFVVNVTLDPDTAQNRLVLSEDLKQVQCANVKKKLPDSPLRFDPCACVLGKQSFSSGRFYFEVQVKGKTEWDLGVAQESINRKGMIPASSENGVRWLVWLRNKDEYWAGAIPPVRLFLLQALQKVGVFVDYGEGLVSFYDADSGDLLFSFNSCCFREKLFPFFSPGLNYGGSNSAPLVLTALKTFRSENGALRMRRRPHGPPHGRCADLALRVGPAVSDTALRAEVRKIAVSITAGPTRKNSN
ncbi:E3 ubiquitin-protein ligase TRIM21-like [Eucyclogobius newberryi]|uniref:E3 ubiquitin-protein ligase TRIM21-like n=1 Tax=Eucyclogobius newberryi TaxID=166745 RepID=UPI003B58E660